MRQTKKQLRASIDMLSAGKDEAQRVQRSLQSQLDDLTGNPRIPYELRVATFAVVKILEQHAEVLSTDTGAGVAAYQRAVQRAGDLRRAIELRAFAWEPTGVDDIEYDAQALYEDLTS